MKAFLSWKNTLKYMYLNICTMYLQQCVYNVLMAENAVVFSSTY